MIAYAFIEALFTSVLQKSKAIGGRFHVSSRNALEINSDLLNEVLQDIVRPDMSQKYPLVLMMPPRSAGSFTEKAGEWERYAVTLFFLKTTHYDSQNQISSINPNTQTSMHTPLQDWHDMKRAAVNFLYVLSRTAKEKSLLNSKFRIIQDEKYITPVSHIGVDRVSGVRVDFKVSCFINCTLEDYNEADITTITVPSDDPHPEHNL